jgi:hypothetical protein
MKVVRNIGESVYNAPDIWSFKPEYCVVVAEDRANYLIETFPDSFELVQDEELVAKCVALYEVGTGFRLNEARQLSVAVTPEEVTPEEVTPEEVTPEEVTPETLEQNTTPVEVQAVIPEATQPKGRGRKE